MKCRVQVFASRAALEKAAALQLVEASLAHEGPNRFNVALSGGSTPRGMYRELAEMVEVHAQLRDGCRFFFSDERPIGPNHVDSNYRTADEGFLKRIAMPPDHVYRMRGEETDLNGEAERYARRVSEFVPMNKDGLPSFDLTYLGLGDDGHTASLFPGYDVQADGDSLVVAPWVETTGGHRLSFTMSLINSSQKVVFLVAGQGKSGVTKAILEVRDMTLPASLVKASQVIWMLDSAAASELNAQIIGELK